jgi:DNA invertase Pin-like site-specific DNA recombinase/peptidoglycan hydrolase-like protein with peptidoglycan-binding domain
MTIKLAAVCGRRTVVVALVAALAALVPATAHADTTQQPVLAMGAGMGAQPSVAVRKVQRVLREHGYRLGGPGVDGRFGPLTAAAVRRLQADYGLAVDGIVGAKTRRLVGLLRDRARRASAGSESKPDPASRTSAPAHQPPPTTTPEQRRTVTTGASNDTPRWKWLIGLALAAAVAAFCAAIAAMRRPRRAAQGDGPTAAAVAPLIHEPHVEGNSRDERIAGFRGHAFATTVTSPAGSDLNQQDTWYLVDDTRKPAPVWVRADDIQRSPSALGAGEPVIGYVTVSPDGPTTEADAMVREVEAVCERTGWDLSEVVTDRETGRGVERPGLAYALEQIAHGGARGLVVTELRRLSRSAYDLGILLQWFRDAQAGLVALDLGIDTSTPTGYEIAATLITLGDWERERLAQRSRAALAEVREGGRPSGRPAVSDRPDLVERITAMRAANMTLQAIADQLNNESVPTLRGGAMWRPSSVQAALGYRRPSARNPLEQLPRLEDRG